MNVVALAVVALSLCGWKGVAVGQLTIPPGAKAGDYDPIRDTQEILNK